MNLVWKLLKSHISVAQLSGFFFANLIGVTIILLGVQFYNDYKAVDEEDSFMKADYIILNKKVGTLSSVTGSNGGFSAADIEEVKDEKFVEKVGAFTPSAFGVRAWFDVEGFMRFSTDMFFESVPDEFVDVESEAWRYSAGSKSIPIILPKNYLDLYNFGYAQGKGLPKLSAGVLSAMKMKIQIQGEDGTNDVYDGSIVGFSSRLNTILVPETFMRWANKTYAEKKSSPAPTRIILEVNNPTDERVTSFIKAHDYETDEDKLNASKTTFILRLVVSIVMGVGVVISLLSLYILMLSIFLLVQKNSSKLENLLLIGYSPAKVSFPYQMLTVALNLLVLVLAVALMLIARGVYMDMLENFFPDMDEPSIIMSLSVGVLLFVFVSVFNVIVVRNKVMKIWHRKG